MSEKLSGSIATRMNAVRNKLSQNFPEPASHPFRDLRVPHHIENLIFIYIHGDTFDSEVHLKFQLSEDHFPNRPMFRAEFQPRVVDSPRPSFASRMITFDSHSG